MCVCGTPFDVMSYFNHHCPNKMFASLQAQFGSSLLILAAAGKSLIVSTTFYSFINSIVALTSGKLTRRATSFFWSVASGCWLRPTLYASNTPLWSDEHQSIHHVLLLAVTVPL